MKNLKSFFSSDGLKLVISFTILTLFMVGIMYFYEKRLDKADLRLEERKTYYEGRLGERKTFYEKWLEEKDKLLDEKRAENRKLFRKSLGLPEEEEPQTIPSGKGE